MRSMEVQSTACANYETDAHGILLRLMKATTEKRRAEGEWPRVRRERANGTPSRRRERAKEPV